MTTHAQALSAASPRPRRSDLGTIKISELDINALLLCAEHHAAPYDLLADALGVSRIRLNNLMFRWRRAGYMESARPGPGSLWSSSRTSLPA